MMKPDFMEKLLDGIQVEWIPLGELCKNIFSGKNKKRNADGIYPVYGSTGVIGRTSNVVYEREHILVARVGANAGYVHIAQGHYDVSDNTLIVQNKENIILKFLYYTLVNMNLNQFAKGAGQPLITAGQLKSIQIPIPCPVNPEKSLEIQAEIVRILDTYTELTAELTAELTVEFSARKKQYIYYRDKLLTFEEGDIEWKILGEIGELVRGNGLPKSDFTEIGVPAIHYGQIYTYYGTFTTETKSFVSHETAKKLKKLNAGDVVITNTSENLEDVGKAVVYLGKVQAVTGGHATIFKPSNQILGKYFAYFTQTEMFATQKRKYAKGTKVIDVSATNMSKILIPIPCPNNPIKSLEEQNRIVSILDKFDAVTSSIIEGLPREIELRQKQYEHYRNMLLSFPKGEV